VLWICRPNLKLHTMVTCVTIGKSPLSRVKDEIYNSSDGEKKSTSFHPTCGCGNHLTLTDGDVG
jgi:hypothetical protein